MKKMILITGIVIYLMFAVSAVLDAGRVDFTAPAAVEEASSAQPTTEKPSDELYLVRSVDGLIAVEDIKTGEIIRKTEAQTALLPNEDRKKLDKGIKVRSKSELNSLLEDLCS